MAKVYISTGRRYSLTHFVWDLFLTGITCGGWPVWKFFKNASR